MTDEELKNLRRHYHALLQAQQVLQGVSVAAVGPAVWRPIVAEIQRAVHSTSDFKRPVTGYPDVMPAFHDVEFVVGHVEGEALYSTQGLLAYLAVALGSLKVEIEQGAATPVVQSKEFAFVSNVRLRNILERDYAEIQRAIVAQCWKSAIILSGGAIEAMLLDLLQLAQNATHALAASSAPKKPPKQGDIGRWDLDDLIKVAVELNLVNPGVERLSHSVREYRNLVHPGNEIRSRLTVEAEEARIAVTVLDMLHRDLSKP